MNEMEAAETPQPPVLQTDEKSVPGSRPWLFALLIMPSAVLANGIVQGGVLAYLMRQQGVGIGRIGAIISLISWPTSLYFLWSPVTDFLVQRRTWLLMGAVSAGLLMGIAFRGEDMSSHRTVMLMFLAACCSQLVVSSCGGMMGTLPNERARKVASSFYQAGSAGFGAAAAFVLIKVSSGHELASVTPHLGGWGSLMAVLVGLLIAVPGVFALAAPRIELPAGDESYGEVLRRLGREFKATFWRWEAIPYTLLMIFPMNSGAAVGLLPGVAQDYGVSGNQVAWMNGLLGALLVAAGSLAATFIPTRVRASIAYLMVGLVSAATLLVLWLGPMRPMFYFVGTTLYLFVCGTGLATFTAVVLEFLGDSGKSGSGRYSIINSLGNVPVLYMIALDGWGGAHWGPRGLAGTEAVMGAIGGSALLAYFLTHGRKARTAV